MSLSFPGATEMFQLTPFPPAAYEFSRRLPGINPARFPHSEIHGSKLAWQLPVAYRSRTTSFVGFWRPIIRHTPFYVLTTKKWLFSSETLIVADTTSSLFEEIRISYFFSVHHIRLSKTSVSRTGGPIAPRPLNGHGRFAASPGAARMPPARIVGVEVRGFEPLTSCLQSTRSPN